MKSVKGDCTTFIIPYVVLYFNRILERATALRDERERLRCEYVENCKLQQWRNSCDEARRLGFKLLKNMTFYLSFLVFDE